MDAKDLQILRALQRNGRIANSELAQAVRLSESACSRRLRELERSGAVVGYTALIDPDRVGLGLTVFLTVTLTSQSDTALTEFEAAARQVDEILECYLMMGEADYLLRIAVADVAAYESLHARRLTRLPWVARVTSSVALRTPVRRIGLPI